MMSADAPKRRVRSFVRREGRLTPGQTRALEELLPRYAVPDDGETVDFDNLFGRHVPVKLEIGFGDGHGLLKMAEADPDSDYLGIEVHRPGVGRLLQGIEQQGLTNIRVATVDAVEFIQHRVPDHSLEAVHIFFPDPWPKKKHHKRRLIQSGFIELIASKLKPGGLLHLATDWEDYAEQMVRVLSECEQFSNTAGKGVFIPRPEYRPLTKFEQRGQRLGHGVWDLVFRRS